jgi:hypothetical protein
MRQLKRYLYWLIAILIYWLSSRYLLYRTFRIFVDDGGAMPTFYWVGWGKGFPMPSLSQWNGDPHYRLMLLYPYWIGATVITLVGCGLTTFVLRRWTSRARSFWRSTALTLIALLVIGAISDTGTVLHVWSGPRMYNQIHSTLVFLKIIIPMSILAGLLQVTYHRISAQARPH